MEMSTRMKRILRQNAESKRKTPYGSCDRWCNQCPVDSQHRCWFYLNDFERRINNIADGKDPNESRVTEDDVKKAFKSLECYILQLVEKNGIDLVEFENNVNKTRKKKGQLYNHPLYIATDKYSRKAYDFLKNVKNIIPIDLRYDYETVSYYSELLPIKMHRALCGIYVREEDRAYDFLLRDGVAQLSICKKSIKKSVRSLRIISKKNGHLLNQIQELLAILHNIYSRIKFIEREI